MTWTYTVGDLAASPKDQVRLLIGDTLTTDQQLQDEEINYLLTTRSSVYGAAAECCRSLQAKFSRSVDQSSGDTKTLYSQMAKAYGVKAAEFEQKAAMSGGNQPFSGGCHEPSVFKIGMDDNFLPVPPVDTQNGPRRERI